MDEAPAPKRRIIDDERSSVPANLSNSGGVIPIEQRESYLAYAQKIRGMEDEKREMAHDLKEMRASAKESGLDVRVLNDAVKRLRMTPDEIELADEKEQKVNLLVSWIKHPKGASES